LLRRFGLGSGFDQPANPSYVFRCSRIVDDHAEVGASIDSKSRVFQRKQTGKRMPQLFRALAMGANIVFTPDRLKFGAETAEFIDQGVDISRCAGSCRIRAKSRNGKPRDALPVKLRGPDFRIKKKICAGYCALPGEARRSQTPPPLRGSTPQCPTLESLQRLERTPMHLRRAGGAEKCPPSLDSGPRAGAPRQ
jgi:hypothetical protein